MLNQQIRYIKPYSQLYRKIYDNDNTSYKYKSFDNFMELKKGDIFIAHTEDGPMKAEDGTVELVATSDIYLDELGIPILEVRSERELQKRKAGRTGI